MEKENIDYVICPICKQHLQRIVESGHLKKHKMSIFAFKKKFPNQILSCVSYNKKLSTSQLGKTVTKETREKISKANKGQFVSREARKKISKGLKGIKRSNKTKEKIRQANFGKIYSRKLKEKLSRSHMGQTSTKKGKTFEEFYGGDRANQIKRKLRKIRIKQIKKNYGVAWPNYNPEACEWFRKFDKKYNTKGRYAVYGGGEYYIEELGYWVDYINFNKKLIIEYDETHHFDKEGNLKRRDVQRQQEIQEFFPEFEFKRIKAM